MEHSKANDSHLMLIKGQIDILVKDWLTQDLTHLMRKTRQEPGLSIKEVAYILNGTFYPSELAALKKLI